MPCIEGETLELFGLNLHYVAPPGVPRFRFQSDSSVERKGSDSAYF